MLAAMYANIKAGDTTVALLVAEKADGRTALMFAARKNKSEMVSHLVTAKADVHIQDRCGLTPLMHIIDSVSKTVEFLVSANADLNIQENCVLNTLNHTTENKTLNFVRQFCSDQT